MSAARSARPGPAGAPLVSVVVPSFNQARYLPTALDSVWFQDYPNIEIVICNHGSTDGTAEVVEDFLRDVEGAEESFLLRYEEPDGGGPRNPADTTDPANGGRFVRLRHPRYPRVAGATGAAGGGRTVKVLQSAENIGGTRSYNEGFRAATGAFCTYLVGDDYLLPTAVSRLAACLEETGADVAYSDLFVVDDAGRILQRLEKPDYSFEKCFADWFHLGVSRLYRRALHERAGWYDPDYRNANDYDMFLRFALAGARFAHLPEVLYCTRRHDPADPAEPASWRGDGHANLLRESVRCALRARAAIAGKDTEPPAMNEEKDKCASA
ncbi:MAG: glycosyltransferase [Desulfovibrionaceae bacterium]|jgi:glycosyltransferase involved in cell wall biosynthesis|nr:glycosyltransferase [Desulfovibrionaceae bacterium]